MPKIVVVEDEPAVRRMMRKRLEHHGYQIIEAEDGSDALTLITRERPELVLMDLNVPWMDGWALSRQLRADPTTDRLPIIAVSANVSDADRQRALAAGCNDFEGKPVQFDRLLKKIQELISAASTS